MKALHLTTKSTKTIEQKYFIYNNKRRTNKQKKKAKEMSSADASVSAVAILAGIGAMACLSYGFLVLVDKISDFWTVRREYEAAPMIAMTTIQPRTATNYPSDSPLVLEAGLKGMTEGDKIRILCYVAEQNSVKYNNSTGTDDEQQQTGVDGKTASTTTTTTGQDIESQTQDRQQDEEQTTTTTTTTGEEHRSDTDAVPDTTTTLDTDSCCPICLEQFGK